VGVKMVNVNAEELLESLVKVGARVVEVAHADAKDYNNPILENICLADVKNNKSEHLGMNQN
jgi:hypothetical protein